MPPRRKLSDFDRSWPIAWLQGRSGQKTTGVPFRYLSAERPFSITGTVKERPFPGQPKKTAASEDRFIRRQALQTRPITSISITRRLRAATYTAVCQMTTRRRLHAANLHARRPIRKPKLAEAHLASRRACWSEHSGSWCCSVIVPVPVEPCCGDDREINWLMTRSKRSLLLAVARSWCGVEEFPRT